MIEIIQVINKRFNLFLSLCLIISMLLLSACADEVLSGNDNNNSILLVLSDNPANPFAGYLGEILNAEGFQGYHTADLDELTEVFLNDFHIVILTEMVVSNEQRIMLEDYVNNGGNLIGMRPDVSLYDLFGITGTGEDVSGGYIRIDTTSSVSAGLEDSTIKFHGSADTYTVSGSVITELYYDSTTASGFAAVALNEYGNGKTAVFSFNLGQSIVYMRQGDPERAKLPGMPISSDIAGSRLIDLMYVDSIDSFNDKTKINIQQADEKMRLLSRIIEYMSSMPLPRLWYFPDGADAVLIATGDSDMGGYDNINDLFNTVREFGGRASIYLYEGHGDYLGDISNIYLNNRTAPRRWISEGHELGIHFDNTASLSDLNPLPTEQRFLDWDTTQEVFEYDARFFHTFFPDAPPALSVRNHYVTWLMHDKEGNPEFAAQGILQYEHGFRMDYNAYHYSYPWQGGLGYQNGSGLPMRLATSFGEILDIYQSDTQLADEVWVSELFPVFKTLANQAIHEGKYAWLNTNLHPNRWQEFKPQAMQMFEYANVNSIPIWNGLDQYDFVSMRDRAAFSNVSWTGSTLSFSLDAQMHNFNDNTMGLTVMIPLMYDGLNLNILKKNGADIPYTIKSVKSIEYAFIVLEPCYYIFSAEYI